MLPRPRRHQLARLTDTGWADVLRRPWDAQARECLAHWASRDLPLVVTRQPADARAGGELALGLPAPQRWERRRLALRVPSAAVVGTAEFPCLGELADSAAPADAATPVRRLARALADRLVVQRATARVFGSHGWRLLTGLDHVRPASDLDLWIGVADVAQADAVAATLRAFDGRTPRLDGELVFGDGAAVAWREWLDWRAGRVREVLVRRADGIALRHDTDWCRASAAPAGVA